MTKAGCRACNLICQFLNLGQFSRSPLVDLTVELMLSVLEAHGLCAPHLGLWSLAAIINSSPQALLVHSPSSTAADLLARPHTGYWS